MPRPSGARLAPTQLGPLSVPAVHYRDVQSAATLAQARAASAGRGRSIPTALLRRRRRTALGRATARPLGSQLRRRFAVVTSAVTGGSSSSPATGSATSTEAVPRSGQDERGGGEVGPTARRRRGEPGEQRQQRGGRRRRRRGQVAVDGVAGGRHQSEHESTQ